MGVEIGIERHATLESIPGWWVLVRTIEFVVVCMILSSALLRRAKDDINSDVSLSCALYKQRVDSIAFVCFFACGRFMFLAASRARHLVC